MRYIIYHHGLDSHPLYVSARELFKQLGLELLEQNLADCGGYYARLFQRNELLANVAYNLALANAAEATLLFLEEDSYANALWAKNLLESHAALLREIETQHLHKFHLLYDSRVQMSYLPDLLNSLELKVQKRFSDFSAALVRGAFQGHLPKSTNHRIYEQIALEVLSSPLSSQYYAHLLSVDSHNAHYLSGKLFFDLADLGVDFIITHSLSQFEVLDSKRGEICRAFRRDNIALPVLFLPQVLLLALGVRENLGFESHKQRVEIA